MFRALTSSSAASCALTAVVIPGSDWEQPTAKTTGANMPSNDRNFISTSLRITGLAMQGVTQIKPGRRPRRSARRHKSVSSMPLPVNPKKDMQCLERLRPKSEGRTIVEPGSRRRHYDISAYSVIGPQGNAVSSPALPASHLELRLDPQFACRVRAARFACWDLAACVRFRAALFACLARASCEAADRSSFFSARNVARERLVDRVTERPDCPRRIS